MNNKSKNLKLLAIGMLVLIATVSTVFILSLKRAGDNLHQFTYMSYVSAEYVPNYKKNFGKWPSDLDKLPSVLESKLKRTQAYYVRERLQLILKFHKENYKGITTLNKGEKIFYYSLLLESRNVKCESNLESGYCE